MSPVAANGFWTIFNIYMRKISPKTIAILIDSARILKQVQHIRDAYSYVVYHVHLQASAATLEERFYKRGEIQQLTPEEQQAKYRKYKSDPTEQKVHELGKDADLVIDTDRCNDEDVFIQVASFFRLLAPTNNDLVDVIVGGQFGSEGKGQIAAHISPEYDCLMRVGGPNAGHTVLKSRLSMYFICYLPGHIVPRIPNC